MGGPESQERPGFPGSCYVLHGGNIERNDYNRLIPKRLSALHKNLFKALNPSRLQPPDPAFPSFPTEFSTETAESSSLIVSGGVRRRRAGGAPGRPQPGPAKASREVVGRMVAAGSRICGRQLAADRDRHQPPRLRAAAESAEGQRRPAVGIDPQRQAVHRSRGVAVPAADGADEGLPPAGIDPRPGLHLSHRAAQEILPPLPPGRRRQRTAPPGAPARRSRPPPEPAGRASSGRTAPAPPAGRGRRRDRGPPRPRAPRRRRRATPAVSQKGATPQPSTAARWIS